MSHTTSRLENWLIRWGPALIVMLAIFFASETPGDRLPRYKGLLETILKKGGHAVGYALLALTYRRGVGKGGWRAVLSWAMTVLYAVSDEFHQSFTPGRMPSAIDVGIDGVAAGLALALAEGGQRLRK